MLKFDRQIVVGLTFDLSVRHYSDGRRYIDIVKAGMIDFTTKLGLNSAIFVGHPSNNQMPHHQGESVAAIASYEELLPFRVEDSLGQVLDVLASHEGEERYSILITDRYLPNMKYHYEKCLMLSENRQYGCKFIFIGVGERYNQTLFQELARTNCQVFHFDDPTKITQQLSESIIKEA